jgi:hypothetical protein
MRTLLLVLCASAGCAFSAPEGEGEPIPEGEGEGEEDPDPKEPAERTVCDRSDPSLRLCVDFEGPIADRSATAAAIAASQVSPMERNGEPAIALGEMSTMHVRESVALDIQGGLALDMWIQPSGRPAAGEGFWILDNNTQYAASFRDTGAVRCVVGGQVVNSAPLPDDGKFHHVACTYDGAKLKVFVDGDVSRCLDLTIGIPTSGIDGLAIGANLSGTDEVPDFDEAFIGGIDDVRVWARSDLDVCAAAGRTGDCKTSCDAL